MKKWYSPKRVLPYGVLFALFYAAFLYIDQFYLKDKCGMVDHAIDVDLMKTCKFFDTSYVIAARSCYKVQGYFTTFFPLDMIFPIVYSLLFRSIIELAQVRRGRKILVCMIVAGAAFDYGEDFSFAAYLLNGTPILAGLTAIFTTLKSCLFALNIVSSILLLLRWLLGKVLAKQG